MSQSSARTASRPAARMGGALQALRITAVLATLNVL
jgi:hypothetical protein